MALGGKTLEMKKVTIPVYELAAKEDHIAPARSAFLGAKTLGEFLRLQPSYTVQERAQEIRCPTLVTEGEGDFASKPTSL